MRCINDGMVEFPWLFTVIRVRRNGDGEHPCQSLERMLPVDDAHVVDALPGNHGKGLFELPEKC